MASFDRSIEVGAHVSKAYKLLSDFERYPTFMEGVEEVRRTADDTFHWRAELLGKHVEWDAKVTELSPSDKIAWRGISSARNAGEVTLDKLDDRRTRVHLHLEYEPEGLIENLGAALGLIGARLQRDLEEFKRLVERGEA